MTYGFRKVSSYTKIYYCRYIRSRVRSGQTKAVVAKRTHRGGVTDVIPNINGLVISTSVHPHIHRMKKRKKNLIYKIISFFIVRLLDYSRGGGKKYVSWRTTRLTRKKPNENPVFVHENHTRFLRTYCRVNASETSVYASIRFNLDRI